MEEKESFKKNSDVDFFNKLKLGPGKPSVGKSKVTHFSGRAFSIIKFILGVCLLAFVYSGTIAFWAQFNLIERKFQNCFWVGVISFIIIYFFIFEPAIIYRRGHRLLEIIFKFVAPLVKVAPYVLPIYTIVIFLGYLMISSVTKPVSVPDNLLFLLGFFTALHLVFSAKSIRAKQGDFLKANYVFGFSMVYIINLTLLAFFLSILFAEFSVVDFLNNSLREGKSIFDGIFGQLFLA